MTANQERRLSPGTSFAWGGAGPPVAIRPAPSYPPTPTPTPLPPAVVESPDAVVVNPKNTTTLYAGTPQGLVKRTQSGGWVASGVGMVYPLRVRAIALDPGIPAWSMPARMASAASRGARSTRAWTAAGDGPPPACGTWTSMPWPWIPLDASVVYAGTGKGVYKSTDAGASWRHRQHRPEDVRRAGAGRGPHAAGQRPAPLR